MAEVHRYQTQEFRDLWSQSFEGVNAPLKSRYRGCQKERVLPRENSLRIEIREPMLGLRLLSVELPVRLSPPCLYLRTWAYDPGGQAMYDTLSSSGFSVDGRLADRALDQRPDKNWQARLKELQLKGIRDSVDLSHLSQMAIAQAAPQIRLIVTQYCEHVVATLTAPSPFPALDDLLEAPDGHPKLLHSWPPKLLQAGRVNYVGSEAMAKRVDASFNL